MKGLFYGNLQGKNCEVVYFLIVIFGLLFASCDYGALEGADKTETYEALDDVYEEQLTFMSGIWYSHYAGIGRLDGYRIGKWSDFNRLVIGSGKMPQRPEETCTGAEISSDDYFVLYDSSVYGQKDDDGTTATDFGLGFCGIVRAVNIFNGDTNRGAIIIEYLKGCAPQWDTDIKNGQHPFFGIYYRVLTPDSVQMANAVNLEAMYASEHCYTEKATLKEAVEANNVENEAEFVAWGVVIPQDREK